MRNWRAFVVRLFFFALLALCVAALGSLLIASVWWWAHVAHVTMR
jgi:hypothetical protein